jgi:flagellar biosynthesis/type III secretory pathway M-ring protein FliF/YscJ
VEVAAPEPLPVRELLGAGRQNPEQDRIQRELRAIAESNPASVAQLIRSWPSEDRS